VAGLGPATDRPVLAEISGNPVIVGFRKIGIDHGYKGDRFTQSYSLSMTQC